MARRAPTPPPNDPTRQRAIRVYETGDLRTALALATQSLKARPRDAELLHLQGLSLAQLGRPEEALEALHKAEKARPMDPPILLSIAQTQRKLQRFDDMNETIERVLYIAPALPEAISLKSQSLRERGLYEQASGVITPALQRHPDNPVLLIAQAELSVATKDTQSGIEACERALRQADLAPRVRRFSLFMLGRLLDQAGRYDEAFTAYEQGNAMHGPKAPGAEQSPMSLWTPDRLSATLPAPDASELPLLIVGMPRSGTTLIEQTLAAHPNVESVGESHVLPGLSRSVQPHQLNPGVIASLGQRYLASLQRVATEETSRVIDKMPGNYLHLGLLSKACPGARIIHAQRDPRDVCLSCYFQNFGAAHSYSRDLAQCARQYVEHLRLMKHWREHTQLRIHDLEYKSLVDRQDETVRALLDFAGLEFDEACLRSHESDRAVTTLSWDQVRQPVYRTSLARWKRYEKHIGPMVDVLVNSGIELPED